MIDHSNDLFLLTSSLAQLQHKQLVKKLLPAGLTEIFSPWKFYLEESCTFEGPDCVEVCTKDSNYGCLMLDKDFPIELRYYVQNIAQLAAVFLERLDQSISDKKNLDWKEEVIYEAEEKYNLLYESAGVGIGYYKPDGTIIFYNRMGASYLGQDPDYFVNKHITEIFGDKYGEVYQSRIEKTVNSNVPLEFVDLVESTVDPKWFLTVTSSVKDKNGIVIGVQFVSTDITDQKQIQAELNDQKASLENANEEYQNLNEELQQTNEELYSTNNLLEIAKQRAEESDRLKSAFLANMSHEIRTPMNGILGFAELLRDIDIEKSDQRKYLEVIESSGERMLSIINNLIDISIIESNKVVVKMEKVDIQELLSEQLDFFLPEASKKGIDISFQCNIEPDQHIIESDQEKLSAILTNLIKNSVKYTNRGSIEFGCYNDEGSLTFYCKDTGRGVEQDKFKLIFERFTQARDLDTKVTEGSGLGLAIAKAYVELLGGKIWAESEYKVGSQFYFTIGI